jgi:hypothetical protein
MHGLHGVNRMSCLLWLPLTAPREAAVLQQAPSHSVPLEVLGVTGIGFLTGTTVVRVPLATVARAPQGPFRA